MFQLRRPGVMVALGFAFMIMLVTVLFTLPVASAGLGRGHTNSA